MKLPFLQSHLPHDARIRYHLIGTLGIGAMLLYHAFYKIVMGKMIDIVSWSLLGLFGFLVLFGILWIPLPFIKILRERLFSFKKKIFLKSYDVMKRFHIGFFLCLSVLMFYHVILANLFSIVPIYSGLIYGISFAVTLGLYIYTKLRNRFLPRHVIDRVESSAGIIALYFTGKRRFSYHPGQFAFIRFDKRGFGGEEHPFSFLSIPEEDKVSFGIRMSGDFTDKLQTLVKGDSARLNGGFGAFRPRASRVEPSLCFIGSGIGSVPFISILKHMHAEGDRRQVLFFLAVNTEKEILEYDNLMKIKNEMPNLQLNLLVWEKEKTLYSFEYFRDSISKPLDFTYYICSSAGVRKIVQDALARLGVKKQKIRFEAFSFG
jgi:predicted ferric reductase